LDVVRYRTGRDENVSSDWCRFDEIVGFHKESVLQRILRKKLLCGNVILLREHRSVLLGAGCQNDGHEDDENDLTHYILI